MNDSAPVFNVTIDGRRVSLEKIEPNRPGYGKASRTAIQRQRDALELHLRLKTGGKLDGVYAFRHLDTARTFAMLHLMAVEHEIQDNIDRILAVDGSEKAKKH